MIQVANPSLEKGVILHIRPYQNTSMLIDFFTEKSGVLRCVAKGFRGKKKQISPSQFCLYDLSFSGKSELKSLTHLENSEPPIVLDQHALFCGLYLNELLLRLLHKQDPYPEIFDLYQQIISSLRELGRSKASLKEFEPSLRRFEFGLLSAMGYLVDLQYDWKSGDLIDPDQEYNFYDQQGFSEQSKSDQTIYSFSGSTLMMIREGRYDVLGEDERAVRDSKVLSRMLLTPLLGAKPLQSKLLFEQINNSAREE